MNLQTETENEIAIGNKMQKRIGNQRQKRTEIRKQK